MSPDKAVVADVTDSLGHLVRSATLPRFMERVAQRAGIQLDRSAVVLLARLAERPRRVGELAELVSLDVSTVSRQVQSLEEAASPVASPTPRTAEGRWW